jgi:hypothetical protein
MDAFSSSLFATQNNLDGAEKVMVVSGSGIKPLSIVAGSGEEARSFRQRRVVVVEPPSETAKALLIDNSRPVLTPLYKTKKRICWEAEDLAEIDPHKLEPLKNIKPLISHRK